MRERPKQKNPLSKDLERFGPVLASIREAVIIAAPDGKVLLANPATEIVTGYLPYELTGRDLQKVFRFKCLKADASQFLPEALEGWRAMELPPDCSIERPQGKALAVAGNATPIYSPDGTYTGIILVLRDITEEAKLRQRQYEFLSFVSHQLREPIGSFRWGTELLREERERLKPSHREILDDLLKISTRFAGFIKDLIDIARFEEGRFDFKIEPVEIRALAEEAAAELKGLAVSHNITLRLFTATPPTVTFHVAADRQRLRDVFLNLFSNAIRYNQPRGSVTVDAKAIDQSALERVALKARSSTTALPEAFRPARGPGGKGYDARKVLLVSVADTGIGIPEDQQANVFGSFFRGSNAKKRGLQGTGLGLFIVKSIVERLGGAIFFESAENTGTTFYLVFPFTTPKK